MKILENAFILDNKCNYVIGIDLVKKFISYQQLKCKIRLDEINELVIREKERIEELGFKDIELSFTWIITMYKQVSVFVDVSYDVSRKRQSLVVFRINPYEFKFAIPQTRSTREIEVLRQQNENDINTPKIVVDHIENFWEVANQILTINLMQNKITELENKNEVLKRQLEKLERIIP